MKYYSTNGKSPIADLQKAVVKGLAEDRGLYMPENINKLPKAFFDDVQNMKFQDIAYNVASNFFGEDVDEDALQDIVYDTLSFDCPVKKVTENIYALELTGRFDRQQQCRSERDGNRQRAGGNER